MGRIEGVGEKLVSCLEDLYIDSEVRHNTPCRVDSAFSELLEGYDEDPYENAVVFDTQFRGMVVIECELNSVCAHHVLPFIGFVSIGYVPRDGCILGLSKFSRIVDVFAHRLQTQEDLNFQIIECLDKILEPAGIVVLIEAQHSCCSLRGARASSTMKTVELRGCFETDAASRQEFYSLVSRR